MLNIIVIMIINHNRHQVSDSKMLDGVRGKQKKVVCKAAPQSNLKVTIPIDITLFSRCDTYIIHNINQLSNLPQLYIMMKFGIHSMSWCQVAGVVTSLITLIKVRVNCYERSHRVPR